MGRAARTVTLSRLKDGAFISGATSKSLSREAVDFVHFRGGKFEVTEDGVIKKMLSKKGQREQLVSFDAHNCIGSRSGHDSTQPTTVATCVYCEDKLWIRFIDMLTYPRPIRKFKMLLDKHMNLALLREMMTAEVALDSISMLVLMTKNKTLSHDQDELSLFELGWKHNQKVIISQVLGVHCEESSGLEEKNKQFVGDLLFGHATNDVRQQGGSIVQTFRVNHGYQILGRLLEILVKNRLGDAWSAEIHARENEEALLASLEAEETKKTKKEKKKKKKKAKKQETRDEEERCVVSILLV
jgi:hypothetical protein